MPARTSEQRAIQAIGGYERTVVKNGTGAVGRWPGVARASLYALAVVAAGLFLKWDGVVARGPILEGLTIAALLVALSRSGPLMELFGGLARGYRYAALLVVAAFLAGHLGQRNTATFPFVSWQMYGAVHEEDLVYDHFIAHTVNGESIPFVPSWAIPSLSNARINRKLRAQIAAIEGGATGQILQARRVHEETVRALIRLHNRKEEGRELRAVDVLRCTVPVRDYQGPASVRCSLRWTVER